MKEYEELTFADDFMFCKILQENEDLCKELTELILNRKIGNIVKPETQKAIQITADGHGVRFDVYFEDDEKTVYDIEMQTSDTRELPLRSRYYQGMIDLDYLTKGKDYKELPDSYIIFLCTFDLFKLGYHKYSFVPRCKEVESLELEDKTNRIFICPGGSQDNVSEDMKKFIDYLAGNASDSDLAKRIDKKVREAIEQRFWRKEYMMLKEMMQDEFEKGVEQGKEQGKELEKEQSISMMLSRGKTPEEIVDFCGYPLEMVLKVQEGLEK
ncbi:Rpn family recombination-promoting nuclease/putative transposase [Butyrivibrio sp. MC2021]|uniref:Rpn family recombination-promoting nuclease/putative transposase n=1 Tax=Butyrivibrio sp. MC2021 TaxID=1408306 RepID=UPI000684834C|nr:Rpn family recombination-promoting nuclease/putative transposase [Butyrivibrio sp. MC2021]